MTYRVLMIAPTPFFADRGCHVRILGEIQALKSKGCEVVLCTYHNGRDVPGVNTIRIPNVPWYDKLEAGPSNHKYYLDLMLLGRTLVTGLQRRPDVVHAHLHEGALIGRIVSAIVRRPLVFDYQGSLTDELAAHGYARRDGLVWRAMGFVERWLNRSAHCVIPSTTPAGDDLAASLGIDRVTTVADGVDTDQFRPINSTERAKVRRRYGLPVKGILAVYVGVLTPYQGIDLLLEYVGRALSNVPDLHLLIVGYPAKEYRARAEKMGLAGRTTFTGRIPFEETSQLTAAADIALAPKISASEGNLKVYNYLACGLPVLAFDNPVNREILGETGVCVPTADGEAFADALAELATDPERRTALGEAARRRAVEELSWARAGRELLKIYEQVGATPSLRVEKRGRVVA